MNKLCRARLVCTLIVGALILGCGLAAAAWQYRIYSWWDFQVYGYMENECHPVWREYNFRRIGPGADLAEVVELTKPARIENYGEFAVLTYQDGMHFTGVGATAYKGRLVEAGAWSCCWTKTFFDIRSQEEKNLMMKEYEVFMKPLRDRWAREAEEEKLKAIQNADQNVNEQ